MENVFKQIAKENCKLHPKVLEFLRNFDSPKILVACSGGADSIFCLILLLAYRKELNLEISLAHYDHKWRPEDSSSDACFVRNLAENLSLNFYLGESIIEKCIKTETSSRKERIRFLRGIASDLKADAISFGHNSDDILETQIQRLARGASLEGLIAPRPIHYFSKYTTHIRPILNFRSNYIRSFLKENQISWCEDVTNKDQSIIRNKLRHCLIPEISKLMKRDSLEGAIRSRNLLEEDAFFLDKIAKEEIVSCYNLDEKLDRIFLKSKNIAITRRALMYWLYKKNEGISISAKLQDNILKSLYSNSFRQKFSLGKSFLVMNKRNIWIEE